MKKRYYIYCLLAACSASSVAHAAKLNLIDEGGVAGSPAEHGFKMAALYWESVLTNDAEINIAIGFQPLSDRVIGSTGSSRADYLVADWERQIGLTKSGSRLDRTAVLPKLNEAGGATFITNGIDAEGADDATKRSVVLGDTVSSQLLYTNTSLLKAMGAIKTNTALDARVYFSTKLKFDFNPTDGIDEDAYDFISVALHEIGHALGFASGVDLLDIYSYPDGPGAGRFGSSLQETGIFSPLDMFRYSKDPTNLVSGTKAVLDLSVGTESYFSIDGGQTALSDNFFSTGAYNGDSRQASHWRDTYGDKRCVEQLGIMDPTSCRAQIGEVNALDLASFDAMGWNISFDVLDNPGYLVNTADIYRQFLSAVPEPTTWAMMLTGFAMVGGALRGRPRTKVKVSFAG